MLQLDRSAKFWHKLWSVRFAILAAILAISGEILPMWKPVLSAVPYATLTTVFAIASAVSRVIHQAQVQSEIDKEPFK